MKKYYCFYCEEKVRPFWWFGRHICPKCLYYMHDKGDGFYKICEKCGSKLPPDAAVCMICQYHFSGEYACKHYHAQACSLKYIRDRWRYICFLFPKLIFVLTSKGRYLKYKIVNLGFLFWSVVLIVAGILCCYLMIQNEIYLTSSENSMKPKKADRTPFAFRRDVIFFDIRGSEIIADTKNFDQLHEAIESAAQQNREKDIKVVLNVYATPDTVEKAEKCAEALEDYIDRYLYKHGLADEVDSLVPLSKMTEMSKKLVSRQAEHTVYVYDFAQICSKIKNNDLVQVEPNIKYLYQDSSNSYTILEKLNANQCINSLQFCANGTNCLPSINMELEQNADRVYWKPNDKNVYMQIYSNNEIIEEKITLSDQCVVTYGACTQNVCDNRCNSLFVKDVDSGLYMSSCEMILQNL